MTLLIAQIKSLLDWLDVIDKKLYNAKSKGSLMDYSKADYCLNNKDILDTSLGLVLKTQDFQIH